MAALSLESTISDVLKNLYLRENIMIRMDKGIIIMQVLDYAGSRHSRLSLIVRWESKLLGNSYRTEQLCFMMWWYLPSTMKCSTSRLGWCHPDLNPLMFQTTFRADPFPLVMSLRGLTASPAPFIYSRPCCVLVSLGYSSYVCLMSHSCCVLWDQLRPRRLKSNIYIGN